MKITILSTAFPYRGGIAVFTERLARAFISDGNDVNISTFSLQYPNFLFPGKSQYSSGDKPNDLKITSEVNSINPFNWIRIGRKIKEKKPDLLILKYWIPFLAPCFGTIARIVRKNHHTKVIVILDNLIPHERRIGDNILNSYFVKNVDAFVAMSASVMDDLNQFDKTKAKLFSPHPVYDNFGKPKAKNEAKNNLGLSTKNKYILFFGIIRKYKGLDILIKSFADKRIKKDKIKLIVAGEFYEDSSTYHNLIKENNLQDDIILVSTFIPDSKVVEYFCASDIIVQPYKNATQSGVTQIAYHFEKPMLVTDVGGLKEIVLHNKVGYVCEPNESSVADALVDFFTNNRESEFIKGVKDEKKKYSWDKMIENIKFLYQKIC